MDKIAVSAVETLATSEIERALLKHYDIAEAAAFAYEARDTNGYLAITTSRLHQTGQKIEVDPGWVASFNHALNSAIVASARREIIGLSEENVLPRFRKLLERWQKNLGQIPTVEEDLTEAWRTVRSLALPGIYDLQLVDYFQKCAEGMRSLFVGAQNPARLMFPYGSGHIAESAYGTNIMAKYLNTVVAEAVKSLRPRRVLEIGAGVGATTAAIISACPEYENSSYYSYVYTDVSSFFIDYGKTKFPGLNFSLFDMEAPPNQQGFKSNEFELIVCAGVLNNSQDTTLVLSYLRELLAPSGSLVITEPTREHYEIMASHAFMMNTPVDSRSLSGKTFLNEAEWCSELIPFGEVRCLPEVGHPLDSFGHKVFVASRPIEDLLRKELPPNLVPGHVEVVAELPTNVNGDLDRLALAAYIADQISKNHSLFSSLIQAESPEMECGEL